jgi:molybdopterin synthase catalytic subunit
MTVTVRFFAGVRECVGRSELRRDLAGPVSLARLLDDLKQEYPGLDDLIRERRVLCSINEEMAQADAVVRDGDEIGLLPPFSGGEVTVRHPGPVRIQAEPFSVEEEVSRVRSVSARIGAVVTFLGTARDFSKGKIIARLEYEQYPGMALKKLEAIRNEAIRRYGVIEASLLHRVGPIRIGEPIVLIVVGAGHRAEAFEACRWCIDELKRSVPIWKKEVTSGGEAWVEDRP